MTRPDRIAKGLYVERADNRSAGRVGHRSVAGVAKWGRIEAHGAGHRGATVNRALKPARARFPVSRLRAGKTP